MGIVVRFLSALAYLLVASEAAATFHTFEIEQLFSNADGTVQFCVLRESASLNGQQFWSGHAITATQGATTNSYVFPNNLPSASTSGRRALIATVGFADLGLVTPDYVVPNRFFPLTGGTVNFAGVDEVSYTALPTDGVTAIDRLGRPTPNVATNFGGRSASVIATAPAPANYQGLWWNPAESGWGINFSHQGDIIFATWFTYDAQRKPWWLVAVLNRGAGATFSGPVSTLTGPAFNAVPFPPIGSAGGAVASEVGSMTVTFADSTHATLGYTVNGTTQTKAVTLQVFGAPPTCTFGGTSNPALATNYQGLWWNPAEAGWGVNLTHQSDVVFATWFTYDATGKPWWLIAELRGSAPGVFAGSAYTLVGPAFDAVPFPTIGSPGGADEAAVGTVTLTVADGNNANFAYVINGVQQAKAITRQVFVAPGTLCR